MREVRARYRSIGMCQSCGLEAVDRFVNCNKCRRKLARHGRRYWLRLKIRHGEQVLAAQAVAAAYDRMQKREAA